MKSAMHIICLSAIMLSAVTRTGAQAGNAKQHNTKNKEYMKTIMQSNKEVIRALYEQALNPRNMKLLQELVSEDYTGVGGQKGPAGLEQPVTGVISAFPDVQWHIEELIAEDDKVFVRWTLQGTHTGAFGKLAATGKKISNDGSAVYELKGGKITGSRVQTDRLAFLQQLDVLPADPAALSAAETVRFIDRFLVPQQAIAAFTQKMQDSRSFLKTLPGFIKDEVYQYTSGDGGLAIITIASWESMQALEKAQEEVQAFYSRTGFQPAVFCKEAGIQTERGIYRSVKNNGQ